MYTDSQPKNDWGFIKTDDFKVNPLAARRFTVIDDFYENPLELREFALKQWFHDDSGFLGLRTRKQFFFEGIKEKFESALNKKISKWEDYEMNARFQSHEAKINTVWHCDSQQWAAAVYLNPDAPYEAGTCFYAHKETRGRHANESVGMFNQHTFVDSTPYEKVDQVGNVFNRCVIWDARLLHAAPTYFGWDVASSRLSQVFFFDTLD